MVNLTIDGKAVTAEKGLTILEAALNNGVYIPHLCGHENLTPAGACGMCAVKIKGTDGVSMACSTKIAEGMDVDSGDELAEKIRKLSCDLIFKTHPSDCTSCPKYGKCQLQTISQYVGDTGRKLRDNKLLVAADENNPIIMHEMYRCILCGRCVRVCTDVRGVGAIRFEKIKGRMRVVVDGDSLSEAGCRFCTACVDVCPTGSIREHEAITAKTEGKSREAAVVPCRGTCPAHIDVPRYIRHISQGDYEAAVSVIREKVPFPHVLGFVCTHPCESECKRGFLNGSVSIKSLKRFAAQNVAAASRLEAEKALPTGRSVAVIGAGPAGLTAAYLLALKGHLTTIFESQEQPGGMMRYGIPGHRLPRNILDDEIYGIIGAGVILKTGVKIDNAPDLLAKGFDAVLTTVGTHRGVKLPLPGADLDGVYLGTDFLRAIEEGTAPQMTGKRVMILGGGNVALDCAGAALRKGAGKAHVACMEARDAMTSTEEERTWALEEGVAIHNSRTFLEIIGDNGRVTGMKLASISGFYFEENGKSVIDIIPESEEQIEVESVIFAIGQRPDIEAGFGLALGRGGRIEVFDDCLTGVPGVFAAGDAVTGTTSVINAIAGARITAGKIDAFLGGNGALNETAAEITQRNPRLGKLEGFGKFERNESNLVTPDKRTGNFELMDLGLTGEQAECEARRCLQCDLRLDIAPQRFWTDYASGATQIVTSLEN